jgi:hypothetical protein
MSGNLDPSWCCSLIRKSWTWNTLIVTVHTPHVEWWSKWTKQNKPYKLFAALWQVTMNIWVKHVFDLLNISIFVFNRYKIFHQVLVLKIFSIIIFYLYALVNSCMLFPTKKENSCMLFDFVFVVIMFSSTLLKPLLQKLIFFQ